MTLPGEEHFTNRPVGSPDVQRLHGAAHGRRWAIYYSRSGYTAQALEVADELDVALFAYDSWGGIHSYNGRAVQIELDGDAVPHVGSPTSVRRELLDSFAFYVQRTLDTLVEIGPSLEAVIARGVGNLSEQQRAALGDLIPRLGQMNDTVAELNSGRISAHGALSKIAQLEYTISLMAAVADIDIEDATTETDRKRATSGFVPQVWQIAPEEPS